MSFPIRIDKLEKTVKKQDRRIRQLEEIVAELRIRQAPVVPNGPDTVIGEITDEQQIDTFLHGDEDT